MNQVLGTKYQDQPILVISSPQHLENVQKRNDGWSCVILNPRYDPDSCTGERSQKKETLSFTQGDGQEIQVIGKEVRLRNLLSRPLLGRGDKVKLITI